jgi:hypothetical protein
MTPARARSILAARGPFGSIPFSFARNGGDTTDPNGVTRDEHAAVVRLWNTLPGSSCYVDALQAIASSEPTPAEIPTDADGIPLHFPEADPLTIPEASYQPGYPGPCPEGMDWSRWLAMNNVD